MFEPTPELVFLKHMGNPEKAWDPRKDPPGAHNDRIFSFMYDSKVITIAPGQTRRLRMSDARWAISKCTMRKEEKLPLLPGAAKQLVRIVETRPPFKVVPIDPDAREAFDAFSDILNDTEIEVAIAVKPMPAQAPEAVLSVSEAVVKPLSSKERQAIKRGRKKLREGKDLTAFEEATITKADVRLAKPDPAPEGNVVFTAPPTHRGIQGAPMTDAELDAMAAVPAKVTNDFAGVEDE